jgi:hypothetical protein
MPQYTPNRNNNKKYKEILVLLPIDKALVWFLIETVPPNLQTYSLPM